MEVSARYAKIVEWSDDDGCYIWFRTGVRTICFDCGGGVYIAGLDCRGLPRGWIVRSSARRLARRSTQVRSP